MPAEEDDDNMSWNPFSTVDNYGKMLNKIGVATFLVCLAAVWFLRPRWPWLDRTLSLLPKDGVEIEGLQLHWGIIVPALAFGVIARAIKLHDKISDVLGIRRRFDICEILLPLALGTSSPRTPAQIRKIAIERNSLMSSVFYKYASSRAEEPKIDKHLIEMALDQWSWYWMLVEASFVVLACSIVLCSIHHYRASSFGLLLLFAMIGSLVHLRKYCARYAADEVEAILSSSPRRAEVAEVFRGL